MANKSVLVIIYDNVEGRILTSSAFLASLSRVYDDIHIAPFAGKAYFDQLKIDHLANYYQATFVKPDINKVRFRLRMMFYHFCRLHKSESSRQKFLDLWGKPSSYFLNYKRISWLYPLACLARWFERGAPKTRKIATANFDAVLFPRPDSSYNYELYKMQVSSETETMVLCRNFDTPTLKGIYTHRFDQTLYFDPLLKDLIRQHIVARQSGHLNPIPYYIDEQQASTNKVFKVIFAISQDRFVQNQISQFELIDHLLEVLRGKEFLLDLRVHFEERHKFDGYLGLEHVTVTNDTCTVYTNDQGVKVNMYSREDIANYKEEIGAAKVLLSHCSTIVYDAYKLKTHAYFLDLSDRNKLHDREHLQLLAAVVKNTIRTKQQLTEVIEKEYEEHARRHCL